MHFAIQFQIITETYFNTDIYLIRLEKNIAIQHVKELQKCSILLHNQSVFINESNKM